MGRPFIAAPSDALPPAADVMQPTDLEVLTLLKVEVTIGANRFAAEGAEQTVLAELRRFYEITAR